MKKSLRLISLALVLCLSVSAVLTSCGGNGGSGGNERNEFISGIGGVSETFTGAVSEMAYDSAEKAAEAYVKNEVVGNTIATIKNVESKGELSSSEIKSKIPSDLREGITSVEKMEVTYTALSLMSADECGVTALADKDEKIVVFVIKYEVDWKYFVPMPITGETVTKSYYDSVFDTEKYKNCTYEYEMETILSTPYADPDTQEVKTMEVKASVKQLIKFDGDKIYVEMTTISTDFDSDMKAFDEVETKIVCFVQEEGTLKAYIKNEGKWVKAYGIAQTGFTSIEQLRPFANQYLDYSYFTKTEYGFKLDEENSKAYINQAMASLASLTMLGGLDLDMYVEYYVSEGTLSGMRLNIDMTVTSAGATASGSGVGIVKCTNYGTTTVEAPVVD